MRALLWCLGICSGFWAGCDSLWTPFSMNDPANCFQNPGLCQSGQVCSPRREVCEPALLLTRVTPPIGPSTGGTLMRIEGQEFTAGMTVTFQGVPAAEVKLVSPTQLQAILPAMPGARGYVAVTVAQPGEQTASRSDLFAYHPGTVSFDPASSLATGNGPQIVAVADFNLDRHLDLATVNFGSSTVSVHLGNGDGTFQPGISTSVGANPLAIQSADLNGDNKPDLLTANYSGGSVSVLLGNGDGTLARPTTITTGAGASYVAVGFANGDSIPDLAIANHDANTVSIELGKGDGTFTRGNALTAPQCTWAAFANLGSGRLSDLAIATDATPQVTVFPSNSDGTYKAPLRFDVGPGPRSLAVSDFNHDGLSDLAVAHYGDTSLGVLLGAQGTVFAAMRSFAAGAAPYTVSLGDINADGEIDLLTGNPQANTVSYLLGVGDGSFGPAGQLGSPRNPRNVGLGDFNEDGLADLASVNFSSNDIGVFINRSQ